MIYVFYGTDTITARKKMRGLVDALLLKKPDASHVRMTADTFDSETLGALIVSTGLFSSRAIVELDQIFENKEAKEAFEKKLEDCVTSHNIFVILEGDLGKTDVSLLKKHAEKIQEFQVVLRDVKKKIEFNAFALSEALGRRDKKTLWTLYVEALSKGLAPEEIHGTLFWQVKAMLLARESRTPEEAGLKPFPFSKSKTFAKNFSPDELAALSGRLVSLYHDAHRGLTDFEIGLEKFILCL